MKKKCLLFCVQKGKLCVCVWYSWDSALQARILDGITFRKVFFAFVWCSLLFHASILASRIISSKNPSEFVQPFRNPPHTPDGTHRTKVAKWRIPNSYTRERWGGNVSKHYTNFTFMQIIVPRRTKQIEKGVKCFNKSQKNTFSNPNIY